jgi:glycosyltransferase involved in cell wall biosynthesis
MSGLAVVTTPNTGSLVANGVNGYVLPPQDTQTMVDRLRQLHADPRLLHQMQQAALASQSEVSLDAYAVRLLRALSIECTPYS